MENINLCIGGCRILQLNEIIDKILDPNITTIFTTAPAPRSALGEFYGKENYNAQQKIVGFLKILGVDYVFDTAFGADLTTLCESMEFIERLKSKQHLPMLNSCCPAFVKYVENFHKELLPNLSTAKTPIAEIATYAKTIFALNNGLNPQDIYIVALTPCVAKKIEIKDDYLTKQEFEIIKASFGSSTAKKKTKQLSEQSRKILEKLHNHQIECEKVCPNLQPCVNKIKTENEDKWQLTDAVITTTELKYIIEMSGTNFDDIIESKCDEIAGESVKFGKSGGVLECVVENAYYMLTNKYPDKEFINYTDLGDGLFEANVMIDPYDINIAKIIGLKNLETFIKQEKLKKYDFIEVMTCQGGCIGGTGQPPATPQKLEERKNILMTNNNNLATNNRLALDIIKKHPHLFYD